MNKAFEKILELIEQKTIQHRDSISFFNECGIKFISANKAKEIVQAVAEEYNGGWIPCSDRLPKYGEVVMCSCSNGWITISCITHKDVNQSKVVRFGTHSVVAWQPLPEPFKERD